MTTNTIGLIGVGLLGSAIAERLIGAGFLVVGFDIDPARRKHLQSLGGQPRESEGDVAAECERIVLCLPNSDVSAAVVDEIRAAVKPGAIVIDTTTGDPQQTNSRTGPAVAAASGSAWFSARASRGTDFTTG